MLKKVILFDAEPFCFGPISTTINLVNFLRDKTNICDKFDLVLLGVGTSKQLAEASKVFDRIYDCNSTLTTELEKFSKIISKAALYISTTNPHAVNFLKNFKTKLYYIDTLFWMWGELRADFRHVDRYFIQRFFNIDKQLAIYREHINCFQVVNPLISHKLHKKIEEKFILINLGGMDTVYHKTSKFYHIFVEEMYNNYKLQGTDIVIAGGGDSIKELKSLYSNRKNLIIDCFGKSEFEDLFAKCIKFISAPGLTSINESYYIAKDVLFLPPQNYSQYLNLKYLRYNVPAVKSISYEDLFNVEKIQEYLPEEDGIVLIKRLSERLINDSIAMRQLFITIEEFIEAPKNKFDLPPEVTFSCSGVKYIGKEICKNLRC